MADLKVPGNLKGLDTWVRGALKEYPKPNRINGSNSIDALNARQDSPRLGGDQSRIKVNFKTTGADRRRDSTATNAM